MKRIDTPNRAVALFGPGKDGFQDSNIATGQQATYLNAAFFNALQEELAGVIEGTGAALNPAANNQLLTAIKNLIGVQAGGYLPDTGIANAYVAFLNPLPAARPTGNIVRFVVAHPNTGASTLNDGFGAVPLLSNVGGALLAGDLPLGSLATAAFNATTGAYLMVTLVSSQALTQTLADARYIQPPQLAALVAPMIPPSIFTTRNLLQGVRSDSVTYTNTSGKPMFLEVGSASSPSTGSWLNILINGVSQISNNMTAVSSSLSGFAIILPNDTYSVLRAYPVGVGANWIETI